MSLGVKRTVEGFTDVGDSDNVQGYDLYHH